MAFRNPVRSLPASAITGQIVGTQIAANSIATEHLRVNALDGKVITGSTIRTSATGPRIVLDSNRLTLLDNAGNVLAEITPEDDQGRSAFTSYDTRLGEEYYGTLTAGDLRFGVAGVTDVATEAYVAYSDLGAGLFELLLASGNNAGATAAEINLYSETAAGAANSQINLRAAAVSVPGILTQGNVKTGRTVITPSAANTPTSVTVTGLGLVGSNPRALVSMNTTVPGTSVTGVAATSVTNTSMILWLTRTNTSATTLDWAVIAGEN